MGHGCGMFVYLSAGGLRNERIVTRIVRRRSSFVIPWAQEIGQTSLVATIGSPIIVYTITEKWLTLKK